MLEYLLAVILFIASLIGDAHEAQPVPTAVPLPTATPAPPAGAVDLPGIVCAYDWPCGQALAIVDCESEGDPWATGKAGERGIWQIHPIHNRGDVDYDPVASTAFAYQLWLARGWSDWSCSAAGAY